MPAIQSSSVSERQGRVSLRSHGLQRAASLSSDDDESGNHGSSANGRRGRGKGRGTGTDKGKGKRGGRVGGINNPIPFDIQIDDDRDDGHGTARMVQPDPSRDTPEAGPIFAYGLQKVPMVGDLPYFNDNSAIAVDDANGRIYMYGGQRPDTIDQWSCDFNVCSVNDMSWQTWTLSLGVPFKKPKPLPCLYRAASTFLRMYGCEYVFLFGGCDDDTSQISSKLIAIDVSAKIWAYVNVKGDIAPRIDAAMVGIGNRLYVFGGRPNGNVEGRSILRSYSVAECDEYCHWSWIVEDEPYTADVPNLGFGGGAFPIYDGMKILLTPGRIHTTADITMSENNVVFFHTENRTFQSVSKTNGNFPSNLQWYNSYAVKPSQRTSIPLPRAAGLPPREALTVGPSHPFTVIVGWIKSPDHEGYLVPEVWQYFIPPKERVQCLNLHRKLWALDLDLQTFITVNGRHFLFGVDEDDVSSKNTVYNVCVELDLQKLQPPPEKKTPSVPVRNVKGENMKREFDEHESEMTMW
ncbi:uncharacterized protein BT62DRAFT_187317 [Guyanagaster necrorhizus]|uniref:Kelch repeat protein n=1 Tax=Guyanagaster necrorhizus TaxID=856835 RepID=A0A9P8ASW0_9AGAR|nr:uncharacterized protein BT62DRAFT_187317 [Guyanagaster necrorhizus MCA 3950]KAG7445267.1 hypothetical protein BT62DRAFT_187317 [Guyanagaster necrorhizus MCA 3950]